MAKIYDISMLITNELPKVVISDDVMFTVNNRKSTVLNVQAMLAEQERAAENGELSNEDNTEYAVMEKVLKMLIGQKAVDSINEIDLPLPEYKKVYETIMAAAMGTEPENLTSTPSGELL